MKKIAVIAGAGPAGLTAALELLRRSDVTPIVFEADCQVGGISKTVNYRGNRMDLGGHRFFSKSDWVMRWWQEILPIAAGQTDPGTPIRMTYQNSSHDIVPADTTPRSPQAARSSQAAQSSDDAQARDAIMLVRRRLSRIFYRRRFFDYPLKLNANTIMNMGLKESARIGLSYGLAKLKPGSAEDSLEDFFVNRFGDRLYRTFFKDYTEKVWGVSCREISAEWGAQRIKGLSIGRVIAHAAATALRRRDTSDTAQQRTETSLIERFLYPKFGPGQMWEEVTRRIAAGGGEVHLRHRVVGIHRSGAKVTGVTVRDEVEGVVRQVACDQLISTIPVSELTALLAPDQPDIATIASALPYRDFMTVGLLVRKMQTPRTARDRARPRHQGQALGRPTAQPHPNEPPLNGMPPDNWIYIQEPDVRLGRLQIFNNWSPAMVADPGTIWLGLEYFCRAGDDLWSMDDGQFVDFAARELEILGLIDRQDVLDGTLIRVAKAYPAYFGAYRQIGKVRAYLDAQTNVYPIGRNGMHRYNNQDHSMLAARSAVTSIVNHGRAKADIWDINSEDEYHEEVGDPGMLAEAGGRHPS